MHAIVRRVLGLLGPADEPKVQNAAGVDGTRYQIGDAMATEAEVHDPRIVHSLHRQSIRPATLGS